MRVALLAAAAGLLPRALATPLRERSQIPLSIPIPHQELFETDDGVSEVDRERDEAMAELLDRYAPVIKLASVEDYYPSSLEYMLPHFSFAEDDDGITDPINDTLLTPSLLDRFPRRGAGLYLSIREPHNPQPFLDEESAYLLGPAGQEGGMKLGEDGRGIVEEPIYGFWVDMPRGVVDLWYWTFYPYNFGKPVRPFGILGNHMGDWEHIRVRTVNGSAVSVDYHAHSGGESSAGTWRWEDSPKVDGRPVAYSAAGSHGLWPTPGIHELVPILDWIEVVDITDDEGAIWDTKGRVVPARYWTDPDRRQRIFHRGESSWLNFRGRFGNKGENDCWWHRMVDSCQLGDAPPGPNRYFGEAVDCVVSPLTEDTSSYSFFLGAPVVQWAESQDVKYVQVEQVCNRPMGKKSGDEPGHSSLVRQAMDAPEWGRDEDEETWSVSGTTSFKSRDQHDVATLPCRGVKAAVKSYRISLCVANGSCITTSRERAICSFKEGKAGYTHGPAVRVYDIDDWWNVGEH